MKRHTVVRFALILVLATPVLSACASFKGSRRIDVGPFAENTVTMIGEVQRANRPPSWVYLRRFHSLPSVVEARAAGRPVMELLRGVALYSTQVVSLYESSLSESRKVDELSRYVEEYIRPSLAGMSDTTLTFTTSDLDAVVADIGSRETLLDALSAVQPLVTATMDYANQHLDELDRAIETATADVGRRVETDFAPLKQQIAVFEELQLRTMRSYTLLNRYRLGEAGALDSLRALDPPSAEKLPAGRKPASKDLDAVEADIIDRLNRVQGLKDQLAPEFGIYREHLAEIETLRNSAEERARLTRVTLILWSRSHRNLAAGIGVPPAIDLKGMMTSTVRSAAGSIVP
jgi:hypothetical protein